MRRWGDQLEFDGPVGWGRKGHRVASPLPSKLIPSGDSLSLTFVYDEQNQLCAIGRSGGDFELVSVTRLHLNALFEAQVRVRLGNLPGQTSDSRIRGIAVGHQ